MVPDQIALQRHRGRKIFVRYWIMVGASILFFFGASDIRSLTQASPAAAKSRHPAPQDRAEQPAPYDHALIDAEAPSGKRHDDLVASFNRGYRGFQSYRACTSVADVVVRRYLEEGAKIARDITARYAN